MRVLPGFVEGPAGLAAPRQQAIERGVDDLRLATGHKLELSIQNFASSWPDLESNVSGLIICWF